MSTIGRLELCHPNTGSIIVYLEHMELYFSANSVPEEKEVPVFLNLIGRSTYSLLRNLLAPTKPVETSLADLCETLQKHFEPKKVVMAGRFQFH